MWETLLLKYVLPYLLTVAHKRGYDSAVEDFAMRMGLKAYVVASSTKKYYAPEDFPKQKSSFGSN